MDIAEALQVVSESLTAEDVPEGPAKARLGEAIAVLLAEFITSHHGIADALDRLATPPEVMLESVDSGQWQAKELLREQRDERVASALERIAEALETANAASLAQVVMDPASPGGLRLVQAVTEIIVRRVKALALRKVD